MTVSVISHVHHGKGSLTCTFILHPLGCTETDRLILLVRVTKREELRRLVRFF